MLKQFLTLLVGALFLAGNALAQPHTCRIDSDFTGVFDNEAGDYTLIVIAGAKATLRANCTELVNSYNWAPGSIQTSSIAVTAPAAAGTSAQYTLTGCNSQTRTCATPITITIQTAAANAPDCILSASPNPAASGQTVTFTAACVATRPAPTSINYVDLSGTIRTSTALTFTSTAPAVTSQTVRHVFYEAVGAGNVAGPQRVLNVTIAPFAPINLQLIGLEVTQVVQDLANSVPLIEDKATVVRAHIKTADTGNRAFESQLIGTRIAPGGARTVLGTLSPSNTGKTIKALQAPSRASLGDSAWFTLPDTWLNGTVELEFRAPNNALACNEPDGKPDCKATVTFNPVSAFSIKLMALTYNDAAGIAHSPSLLDALLVANELLVHFPINRFDGDLGQATTSFNACRGFAVTASMRKELNSLRNTDCKGGSCKQYYHGLLADKGSCAPAVNANGESDLPGNATISFYPTDRFGTRAHEQGHALGLKHVDYSGDGKAGEEGCADAAGKAVPCTRLDADGTLSGTKDQYAATTAYGFDTNSGDPQQIFAAETSDLMSYGATRWTSRANYVQLYNKFKLAPTIGEMATPVVLKASAVTAVQTVLVDGSVVLDGSAGSFGSLYVSPTPASIDLPLAGAYTIRLENAQGTQLASYSFDPVAGSETPTIGNFSLQLPWDPAARKIVLSRGAQVLASRQASATAPTITVTSPNGGEVLSGPTATFTWTASDADGDALTYIVEYSIDNGGTWRTLALDWNAKTLSVDLMRIPGSTQALIRVTASDGFLCAQDQSNAVFTVPPRAPQAVITAPAANALYVADQTVNLKGMAVDVKDGLLASTRLTWSSSLNGSLGTGSSLSVSAANLIEGTHTITLTAANGASQSGMATTTIRVFRARPALPAALSGSPGALAFAVASGGAASDPQLIAIRNTGDGDINWTATSDQGWLKIAESTGAAPANLSVTASPQGLPPGVYTAKVTITSASATNSPQSIQVTLLVTAAVPPPAIVVEYVDTLDFPESPGGHFFYSSDPAEQAAVDAGAAGRFSRTTRQFKTGGSSPVCRFYGSMSPGPNSHFFTVEVSECNALRAAQLTPVPLVQQQWNFEGMSYNTTPASVASNGTRSCPAGTLPLYRAYNNAFPLSGPKNPWDSNHRFTPVLADIGTMVAQGWRDEGIVFCTAQ